MNFLRLLLLLLPSLAAGQGPGIPEYCLDFMLEVTSVTFQWQNCQGGELCEIGPQNEVFWGRNGTVNGRSGLVADGDVVDFPITLPPNNQFLLGQLTHINYPLFRGGGIDNIELSITLDTNVGTFSFVYLIEVEETLNDSSNNNANCPYLPGTAACADRVLIINDPQPFEIAHTERPDIRFEIDLLGFRTDPNSATKTEFISVENGQSQAGLYGSLYLVDCPNGGGGMGDPHFKTWTGQWYDFHGACDMHLVDAPKFAPDLPLTIDIRTHARDWYSFIERAALKIGDDVLEVAGFGEYTLNGVTGFGEDFLHSMNSIDDFAGFKMTYANPEKHVHVLTVEIEGQEAISIQSFKDMVSVNILDAHKDRFAGSSGMMGHFETGYVYSRDGKTVMSEPSDIAREWQVRDDEEMLFGASRAPQYPQECVMPKKKEETNRLGKTVARAAALKACAHWSLGTREMCIQDVMKTGDVEMAKAEKF